MFLILRLFNSILFLIANFSIGLYTLQRFFKVMKTHYELVKEVEEFSSLVDQSRKSLNYVGEKIKEAMKEMESDIGKEVLITHNLTKLSTKISSVSKRFNDLEEGIIELARLNHNMENATVETPSDINDEVRKIMSALKRKTSPEVEPGTNSPHRGRSPIRRRREMKSDTHPVVRSTVSPQPPSPTPSSPSSKISAKSLVSKQNRTRSPLPVVVPEVTLLQEHHPSLDKPIGFRPAWMCEA